MTINIVGRALLLAAGAFYLNVGTASAQGPAVSAPNGKLEFDAGALSLPAPSFMARAAGTLTLPIGDRFGLQADFSASTAPGLNTSAAFHLFTRDPQSYLIGGALGFVRSPGAMVVAAGPEAELYLDRWTLEAWAGASMVRPTAPAGPDRYGVFALAGVGYYPTDNWRLSLSLSTLDGYNAVSIGSEYLLDNFDMPISVTGEARLGQDGAVRAMLGLRGYFGPNPHKTLIDRHRQDDPTDLSTALLAAANPQTLIGKPKPAEPKPVESKPASSSEQKSSSQPPVTSSEEGQGSSEPPATSSEQPSSASQSPENPGTGPTASQPSSESSSAASEQQSTSSASSEAPASSEVSSVDPGSSVPSEQSSASEPTSTSSASSDPAEVSSVDPGASSPDEGPSASEPSIPDDTSSIPDDTSSTPDDTSSIPDDTSSIPDDTSSVPGDTSSIPDDTSSIPDDTSSVPDDTSSVQDDTSSIPDDTSSVPDDSSSPSSVSEPSSTPNDQGPDWCTQYGINTWDAATQTCTDPLGNQFFQPSSGGNDPSSPIPDWCSGMSVVWDSDNGVCRNADDGSIIDP